LVHIADSQRQAEALASLYSLQLGELNRTHRELSLAEISGAISEDWNVLCKMTHPSIFWGEILMRIQLMSYSTRSIAT